MIAIRPAAAAQPAWDLIAGPGGTGDVLAVFPAAALLQLIDRRGRHRILTLLGPGATGVPNGVRPLGALPRLRATEPFRFGDGVLELRSGPLRMVRAWPTGVRPITVPDGRPGQLRSLIAPGSTGLPVSAPAALAVLLDHPAATPAQVRTAVDGLVGLGLGLTPAGDDVLAGVLIGLRAAGQDTMALAAAIADRVDAGATTAPSAELLTLAAAGQAALEVLALLGAVHRGPGVRAAAGRVLAMGHTSGADLLTGLAIGLTRRPHSVAATSAPYQPPRPQHQESAA